MPHLSSNIPSAFFYRSIFSELLQIARWTLIINDFMSRVSHLISKMIAQCENRKTVTNQIKKAFHRCQTVFQKFGKTLE